MSKSSNKKKNKVRDKKRYNESQRRKKLNKLPEISDFLDMNDSDYPEKLKKILKDKDPIDGAATIAGLCISPELQSDQFLLEWLTSAFLHLGQGKNKLNEKTLFEIFKIANQCPVSFMNDPAENVFVSLVYNKETNYRIWEGLWEGGTFILQRFIDILIAMPNSAPFKKIKDTVFNLLSLSDCLAERTGLEKYCVGSRYPTKTIPQNILQSCNNLSELVIFSEKDLKEKQINHNLLSEFTIEYESYIENNNDKEEKFRRKPILKDGNKYYVMMPSAINIAIRQYVIEEIDKHDLLEHLERSLGEAYSKYFSSIQLLGKLGHCPIQFKYFKNSQNYCAPIKTTVDIGREINFIFVLDNFENKDDGWFEGMNKSKAISENITSIINKEILAFQNNVNLKETLFLVVICGWGRGWLLPININPPKGVFFETISAQDLDTLSYYPGFSPLALWRLLQGVELLENAGVELMNMNGLLNLYSFSENLNGHLLPHEKVTKMNCRNNQALIGIGTDFILPIREKTQKVTDKQLIINPEGIPIHIIKKARSCYFEEDMNNMLYVSEDDLLCAKLRAVFQSNNINWWCSVISKSQADSDIIRQLIYKIWDAASDWLIMAVPVIEKHLYPRLSIFKHLNWNISIETNEKHEIMNLSYEELHNYFHISIAQDNSINVRLTKEFIKGIYGAENNAERCLVKTLILGINKLTGNSDSNFQVEQLLDSIIPDKYAKHIHMFQAVDYLDFFQGCIPKPFLIDKIDDANNRIMLGIIDDKTCIKGVKKCTTYLDKIVTKSWNIVKDLLIQFDCFELIQQLLENLNAISADVEQWDRTIKSSLSLHKNKEDILEKTTIQKSKLDTASLATRLAIEMAICECKDNKRTIGELELTKLLSYVKLIFDLGGISDAIKNGVIEPQIEISAYGDILYNTSYHDNIVTNYFLTFQKGTLKEKSESYDKLFLDGNIKSSSENLIESNFLEAWQEEYGISIDDINLCIDLLEDYGIKNNKAIFSMKRDELLNLLSVAMETEKASSFIDNFSLFPRKAWHIVPSGFSKTDWQPWKYRRMLSLISRPMVKINDHNYLLSPSIIRKGIRYLCVNCYDANFDKKQFISPKMISWIGQKNNESGHAFNQSVSNQLTELGWETRSDIELPEILNKKLTRQYGDIDVLAWNKEAKRILAIECKDLQMAKTHGEISRQIQEFRGVCIDGKPDRFKKHLNRLECLTQNYEDLLKFIDGSEDFELECHLVFSKVVPMCYSDFPALKNIKITIWDNLQEI